MLNFKDPIDHRVHLGMGLIYVLRVFPRVIYSILHISHHYRCYPSKSSKLIGKILKRLDNNPGKADAYSVLKCEIRSRQSSAEIFHLSLLYTLYRLL